MPEKKNRVRKFDPRIRVQNLGIQNVFPRIGPKCGFLRRKIPCTHFTPNLVRNSVWNQVSDESSLGRTPKGSYSPRVRSRHLLENPFSEPGQNPFSEPLLNTLLKTLSYCKTHSRHPSQNPCENPFSEPFPEPFPETFLESCTPLGNLR